MTSTQRVTIFALLLFASWSAFAQVDERPASVHVIGFEIDRQTSAIQPIDWRAAQWPNLRYETEEALRAVPDDDEEARKEYGTRRIAVRALDRGGNIIYRGIVTVPFWQTGEGPEGKRIAVPIETPQFTVVVPSEAKLVTFDGWTPSMRSTFDVGRVVARFSTGRLHPLVVAPPKAPLAANRLNIVIFGDGYQQGTANEQLFHQHAQAALQQLWQTSPYNRYRQFWNAGEVFVASTDSGANHPACADHTQPDPLAGNTPNHHTAFDASYCSFGIQRLLTVTTSKVDAALRNLVDGTPTLVLVVVNDSLYGGSGAPYGVASTHLYSPFIAIHELAHIPTYTNLQDEYVYSVGFPHCSDLPASSQKCAFANVTDNDVDVKWQRWINGTPQKCTAAQQTQTPMPCNFKIGLYEGAWEWTTGGYRPQFDCLMRTIPASGATIPFCSICSEQHIRSFYAVVDPFKDVLHPELRDNIARVNLPPADVHVGDVITLGVTAVGLSIPANANPANDPDYQFEWYLNGFRISNASGPTYNFSPTMPITSHIEVKAKDPTPLLRSDPTHLLPPKMSQVIGWNIVSDARVTATTAGTDLIKQQSPVLTVPKGTTDLTLTYTLNTSEPGGARPGDFWSVTVSYAGTDATAFAAQPIPFHIDGTITSIAQNGTVTVPIQIDAKTADRQVVVEIAVKNLETDTFIPTTVSATLSPVPIPCGAGCDYCAAHPFDPACPVQISIQSAQLVPLGADTNNRGDSSYFSLGEKLDQGRHLIMKLTTPPAFARMRVVATALAWEGTPLLDVRDVTWTYGYDYRGLTVGLERDQHNQTLWDLNISPKKSFPDITTFPALTPDQWRADIRYRLTITLTMGDGRTGTVVTDVTNIISPSSPGANDTAARPLHALWHTPKSQAQWHYWSSVAMHNWLASTTSIPFHIPDRIADEDAVNDTPLGHEAGTGITEVPFFPGAVRWGYNPTAAYDAFRKTANAALDGALPAGQAAARDTLVTWINQTRTNLQSVLGDYFVSLVRIGDGGSCGHGVPVGDRLPEGWMRSLLMNGRIIDATGKLLLDLTDRVASDWNPANVGKLAFDCIDNIDINILLDRCRIGDMRGPCIPGRIPGRRTFITTSPQSTTIAAGQSATLFVGADGEDLHYQWYVGSSLNFNQPLSNATADTITVSPAASTSYWVLVSGALGDAASAAAVVTVSGTGGPCNAPPSFTQQPPATATLLEGQSVNLTVAASGDNVRYQWYRREADGSATALPGATQPLLVVAAAGQYFARAYNECGAKDSIVANVTVVITCELPSVVSIGASTTSITPGQPVTLSLVAAGKQPITIIWYEHTPDDRWSSVGMGIQVTVTPPIDGTEYFAGLSNACGSAFTAPITICICTPPSIVQQPAAPQFSSTVTSASMVVVAIGSSLHYAWTIDGAPYGDDAASITITVPASAVTVAVRVFNSCGSVMSNAVLVAPPCTAPAIDVQPQSVTVVSGSQASFSVTASGTAPLAFQWFEQPGGAGAFTAISGATSNSLTIVPPTNGTQYNVAVSNACGSLTSGAAIATLTPACAAPLITASPQSVSIHIGETASLTSAATGTEPMSVQWEQQTPGSSVWTAVSDGTSTRIDVSPSIDGTAYRAVFTNSCGTATTTAAVITVLPAPCQSPAVVTPPQDVSVTTGQPATLTLIASGTQPMTIEWHRDDGALVGTGATVTFVPPSTATYTATLTNACGTSTTNAVTVTVTASCIAPAISAQPQAASITAGQTAPLSVAASGTGLQYQWYLATTNTAISGATSSLFQATPSSTTSYYVIVANACGSVQSNTVTVTVGSSCQPPAIATNPQSVDVTVNDTVTLSVSATGSEPLTYRWFDQFGTFAGQGSSISFVATATRSYYALVSNECGSVQSSAALVTVSSTCSPPSIVTDPQSATITAGGSATLTVLANGTGLSFQWFTSDGTAITGATAPSTTVTPATTTSYYVRITNACGTVISGTATVTVNAPACVAPSIFDQPGDTSAAYGDIVTLTVGATGDGLRYQWYNGASGDTTARLYSTGNQSASVQIYANVTTQYWVRVTGTCGVADSRAAMLTVASCTPAFITEHPASTTITAGSSTTLHVSATGTGPLRYQWYVGVTSDRRYPVNGATSASLDVSPSQTTSYWVMVSNACSDVQSDTSVVTVSEPCTAPAFASQPQSTTIQAGSSTTLSVSVTGTQPIDITWTGSDGSNAGTGVSITVSPTTTTSYTATATNVCGSATSSAATVTVTTSCTPPTASIDIITAARILHANATGDEPLHYQWYQSTSDGFYWTPVGTDSAYYTYPAPVPGNEASYKVVVANACGTAESNPVTPPI